MIELKGCSVKCGEKMILSNVSLEIPKGAFYCLIGESGGGKTMISRTILDMLPPSFQVTGSVIRERDKMEIILQDPIGSLQPNIKIGTQIHHLLKSKGRLEKGQRELQIVQMLEWAGFEDAFKILRMYPFQLSGGMCQKVAIAISLLLHPDVLIADEPTSALDRESQENILKLITRIYLEKAMTIIFITHDLNLVKKYATHIGIVHNGQVVEAGTVQDVLTYPKQKYTKELICIFEQAY